VNITLAVEAYLAAGELAIGGDGIEEGYWYEFPGVEEYEEESILEQGYRCTDYGSCRARLST